MSTLEKIGLAVFFLCWGASSGLVPLAMAMLSP